MAKIVWRDKMAIGIPEIDADHRALINYINDLDSVVASRHFYGDNAIDILDKMTLYTIEHFGREEEAMERLRFSKLDEHRLVHVAFTQKLNMLRANFISMPVRANAAEVLNLLSHWLINHVVVSDLDIRRSVAATAPPPAPGIEPPSAARQQMPRFASDAAFQADQPTVTMSIRSADYRPMKIPA